MWLHTNGALDYQLHEFTLAAGDSASFTLVVGVNDGGANAPDVGEQIFATATDRAAGVRPDIVCQIEVDLDIKPCSNPNAINLAGRGVIPVAIKHTDDFDPVARVNVASLRFGAPDVVDDGGSASPAHDSHVKDVVSCEGDGRDDLVFHFPTKDADFDGDETMGKLVGKTTDGTPLVGTDSVRLV